MCLRKGRRRGRGQLQMWEETPQGYVRGTRARGDLRAPHPTHQRTCMQGSSSDSMPNSAPYTGPRSALSRQATHAETTRAMRRRSGCMAGAFWPSSCIVASVRGKERIDVHRQFTGGEGRE